MREDFLEKIKFKQVFKLDDDRLLRNYERINRMFKNCEYTEILAKFLINQSIGLSPERIIDILNYYKLKLHNDRSLLEFAFEWVRANKIRFDYKKFINLAKYEDLNSAIDDTIFHFFLDYDEYIRDFFIKDISETEICALYEIFFNPKEVDSINLDALFSKHEVRVHTISKNKNKVNTNIFTLREGIKSMIKKDYSEFHVSKVQIKNGRQKSSIKPSSIRTNFDGTMLERLIKSYCFNKRKIVERELENSISSFLSSFLRFGQIYKYEDFKGNLEQNLTDSLIAGLPESQEFDSMNNLISANFCDFEKTLNAQRLDGSAWIKDLIPILKEFVTKFIDTL